MNIQFDTERGTVPVTVIRVHGEIDRSNFQELLDRTVEQYNEGARNVLLDLRDVPYMSSAGMVALQGIIRVMNGQGAPDTEHGWGALHGIDKMRSGAQKQEHFKLLGPQALVLKALDSVGFTDFIEIFEDEGTAVSSF